jgi:hypothetical protein
VQRKLKLLIAEDTGPAHDDICQVAQRLGAPQGTNRYTLALWNFGQERMDQWERERETYKFKLIDDGWEWENAWQACKAWEDAGTTYALWKRWQAGKLTTSPPAGR